MKLLAIAAVIAATSAAASENAQDTSKRDCISGGLIVMLAVGMIEKYQAICRDVSRSRQERDVACTAMMDTVRAMNPGVEWLEENCPAE